MEFLKLEDMDIEGKRVLVRVDFNVPLKNGKVSDDNRLRQTLPTINYLLEKNCKIILMSHLGRPQKDLKKGKSLQEVKEKYTMKPVANRLKELLNQEVSFVEDYIESGITDDKIILLENLRFYKEEKKNDEKFAEKLASFADIYINDGFGACHRDHASVVAVTKFLPSCAGFLVEKEVNALSKLLDPEKPFIAIIGGAKADKIGV
jgi:3-phosphoglycerate kinase